jgi:hypothetical protein
MNMSKNVYENAAMRVEGSKLIIEVELDDVTRERSKSGKSDLIATTGGNTPAPGRPKVKVGLNVYEPAA